MWTLTTRAGLTISRTATQTLGPVGPTVGPRQALKVWWLMLYRDWLWELGPRSDGSAVRAGMVPNA